jgi:O-antigen/teichoic acid export membrane protein
MKANMSTASESGSGRLARNTAMNIAGQVIPLLVAVATIPYVVRGLGPERFGILSIAWLVLGYFALLDFGLGRAATKFIAECLARGESERLPGLFWTSLGLHVFLGCCGGLILAILSRVLVGRIFHVQSALQSEARNIFLMLACSLPVVLSTNGLRAVLEAAQRFDVVNYLRVPASISVYAIPALGVALGATLPQIVLCMVLARLLVSAAHAGACFVVLPGLILPGLGLRPRWSGDALHVLLRYGGWVTVSNLANPILLYVDRFFIGSLLSLSLLGSYTVPFEAVTKLWIIPASLASTLFPAFSALTASPDLARVTRLYSRSFKYLLLLLGPVILLLVLFAREILTVWMGAAFAAETTGVLQILACGVLVNCFAHIPFGLLQSHGHPDLAAKVLLIELPLYLPLAWFLVRHWGIPGAATGWTLRVAVEALVFGVLVSKLFALDPHAFAAHGVGKSLLAVAALGIALAGAKLLLRESVPAQLACCVALTAVFCAIVWRKIFDRADRGQVQGLLVLTRIEPRDGLPAKSL